MGGSLWRTRRACVLSPGAISFGIVCPPNSAFEPICAGRRDVFAFMVRHLKRGPKRPSMFYDYACSTSEFNHNRDPKLACDVGVFHDRCVCQCHASSRTSAIYSPDALTKDLVASPLRRFHQRTHFRCSDALKLLGKRHGGPNLNTSAAGMYARGTHPIVLGWSRACVLSVT
jgi:hypothetical protein